ncbi:alpha/beta fold hydrolase [Agromyces humatus]|uniref:Alpha/beta hydrolase n=1 Tax=Agromyces humatus TaxID=279573 RepID=A0ABP4WTT8_9MICO|nr:alpha/beta hydrolase [Agromyces humatus]
MSAVPRTAAPWTAERFVADGHGGPLRIRQWGPDDAPAVVFHHGTPSTGAAIPGGWAAPGELGIRVISYDRPGYGGSTARAGYAIADGAEWARRAADAFGVDAFATMGTSGGGPFAAATAALAPDRVTRLCICVGIGPAQAPGFDSRAGMLAETVEEIDAASRGEAELRAFIDRLGRGEGDLSAWMSQLPARDRAILGDAAVQHEEAVEHEEWTTAGVEGWVNDDLAIFERPWGFDLSSIAVPTLLAYGAADVLVPLSHGVAYESIIPGARLSIVPDAGHWLRPEERDLLVWLTRDDGAGSTR